MSLVADAVFVGCVPACIWVESRAPRVAGRALWSMESLRDAVYLVLKGGCALLAGAIGARLTVIAPHRGIAGLPFALQCLIVLLVIDVKQYAVHRITHRLPWLWRLHKVHHASRHISWLACGPTHLLDYFPLQLVTNSLIAWAFAADPMAWTLGVAIPSIVIGGLLAHLNVDLPRRLGLIGRLIVTPNYHAHHHALHTRAVNLAEVLPLWDILFGTFEEPSTTPREFGIYGESDFPTGLVAQQLSPFRGDAR